MAYLLDVLHDGARFDQYTVETGDELVFGRGARSTVRLPDAHLSDPHLAIVLNGRGRLQVRDLGSKNGTKFNGRVLSAGTASAGDVLRFGACTLIVRALRPSGARQASKRTELEVGDSASPLTFTEGARARSSSLETLVALAEALVGEASRDSLIGAAETALSKELEFDHCFVLMRDGDEFRPVSALGVESGSPALMSRAVLREITLTPKALLVEDPQSEVAHTSDSISDLAITSFICCPMIVQDEVIGVIYADRLGASPAFDPSHLRMLRGVAHLLGLALHDHSLRVAVESDNQRLRRVIGRGQGIIARSPVMIDVLRRAERLAGGESPVLITGETGTGKELIARLVHDHSPRAGGPFVPFNCALSSAALIDSELFGHVDGAFTGAASSRKGRFQLADKGTLFLDEIGDMPLDSQAKLLRVLQEKQVWPVGGDEPIPVNVRIVSATNQNLAKQRRAKEFRDDLYYRVAMFLIELPRLASRGEDVIEIAESFLSSQAAFSAEVHEALLAYSWPGNVRELEGVVLRACFSCRNNRIRLRDLPTEIAREGRRGQLESATRTLREMEADHIAEILRRVKHNKKRAAEELGISRDTLYQKIRLHGLGE